MIKYKSTLMNLEIHLITQIFLVFLLELWFSKNNGFSIIINQH